MIMKKLSLLIFLLQFSLPLLSQTIEKRNVGEYDEIHVSGWFDVELITGEEGTIELEGREKYLKNISTEVIDGVLKIKWERSYNIIPFYSWSDINITIPVNEIVAVALSGSGSIVGKTKLVANNFETRTSGSGKVDLDVEAGSLKSVISGSGDTLLRGTANDFIAEVSGSGDIEAFGLKANSVTAVISGSADIEVHANESVKARISGSGDVRYIGNARKIDSKISGSGSIKRSNSL